MAGRSNFFASSKTSFLKIRKFFLIFLLLYFVSFLLGYLLVSFGFKPALALKEKLILELPQSQPFSKILSLFAEKRLPLVILLTFGFNLTFGAFFSTTLSGLIFFLPLVITFYRGLIVGLVYSGIFGSLPLSVVGLGTLFFEFLAYSLSGACGFALGLSFIFPSRHKTKKRLEAFRLALRDTLYLYPFVCLLLFLGAIWEMVGLFILVK